MKSLKTEIAQEEINKLRKLEGFKSNIHNSITFINAISCKILILLKQFQFQVLRVNLTKEVKDLYNVNYMKFLK